MTRTSSRVHDPGMHPIPHSALLGILATLLVVGPTGSQAALAASDATPPAVTAPLAAPAPGKTVRAAAVPVRVAWTATDAGTGVAKVALQMRIDGGSWTKVILPRRTARHAVVSVRPPHDAQFRVRARDAAGNLSPWMEGEGLRWTLDSERAPGVTATGTWSVIRASGFLGDRALRGRDTGAELSFTFSGSQVAWIGRPSRSGGSARVYLDGEDRAVVSTFAVSRAYRRVLYVATWPEPGDHTLTIRVLGTPGHPNVVVDGFIVGDALPADPVLVGAGDVAYCSNPGDNRTADLLDAIPGRVFVAGDTVYPDGTKAQFRDCYDPTWGRWRLRTSPAVGNHEYHAPGAGPYWDYFGSRAGDRGKGWYAYDLGTWRVYTLNANCTEVGCGPGSEQEQWLRADLAANPRACVAAVMHQPLFSSGQHGGDPSVRPLWEALDAYGAEVVLAGHDHDYERFAPQTPAGVASAAGIREFVVGTGGAPLRPFATVQANSEVREASAHGVLRLTLRDGSYDWLFVPIAGQSFTDSGSGDCH
jgi:hypothetical protein